MIPFSSIREIPVFCPSQKDFFREDLCIFFNPHLSVLLLMESLFFINAVGNLAMSKPISKHYLLKRVDEKKIKDFTTAAYRLNERLGRYEITEIEYFSKMYELVENSIIIVRPKIEPQRLEELKNWAETFLEVNPYGPGDQVKKLADSFETYYKERFQNEFTQDGKRIQNGREITGISRKTFRAALEYVLRVMMGKTNFSFTPGRDPCIHGITLKS